MGVKHGRWHCGRVFENKVLRRIFGPRKDEVTGEWRWLHNEELNDLYFLTQYRAGDKTEKNVMGWACDAYGWWEGSVKLLVGETGGKETTGET